MLDRRAFLTRSGLLAAAATFPDIASATPPSEVRIGYQKSSFLAIVREQKLVERRYGPSVSVRWNEFQFGPPLLEAMNAGRIDYGYAGNTPPVFAQAARADFVYVAALPGRGDNVGILTAQSSGIKSVADLKGRRVAVGKGSSGHDFLVAALEAASVPYDAIAPVYLAPADGAAALARGAVEAWSIWDPYFAIAQTARPVKALPVGPTVGRQSAFFLANRSFAESHPEIVRDLNADVAAAAEWGRANRDDATALFAKATGVDLASEKRAVDRTAFTVAPMSDDIVREQQAVADRFQRIGLIPNKVNIVEAVWRTS